MSRKIKTKEQILQVTKEIVISQGIKGLTMRNIAQKAGIALGSIYNYFETKDDIILSLVSEFWRESLIKIKKMSFSGENFAAEMEMLYRALYKELSSFQSSWLGPLRSMDSENQSLGLLKMQKALEAINEFVHQRLLEDNKKTNGWQEKGMTTQEFARFVCHNLFAYLMEGTKEIPDLLAVIKIVTKGE